MEKTIETMQLPDDNDYVDITDELNQAVATMNPGTVVASPYFDMLDGARALEIGNTRLDTGLIELDPCDVNFNAAKGQDAATVASIMHSILVLYMSWLLGLSLLVTVLSNRYVLDFLNNYKNLKLEDGFVNRRLLGNYVVGDTMEEKLVNIVLQAYVMAMCKHMGFCRSVSVDVLYDEEDLITRTMDLDLLTEMLVESIVQKLDEAVNWIEENRKDKAMDTCILFLQLARHMVHLERVLHIRLNLFAATKVDTPYIDSALEITEKLSTVSHVPLPKGAVSRFDQLDCNNKHIPAEIVSIPTQDAYTNLSIMLRSIRTFIDQLGSVRHVGQLETLLHYTLELELPRSGVLSRGMFLLFFIRDDKSIAGLAESVRSISTQLMERISLCGSSLTCSDEWRILTDKVKGDMSVDDIRNDCLQKLSLILDDVENAIYQKFSIKGHNRCRQRQLNSRNIVLWDLLQYLAEHTELELFSYGIGDRLVPGNEEAALGLSSFIYLQKMETMMEVALSGFEQDLYKPHEAAHMWWLAGYVADMAHKHLAGRVRETNTGKLASVAALSKKIKKTKAGPAKDIMRQTLRRWEDCVAQLNTNVAVIDSYMAPAARALAGVCIAVGYAAQLLNNVAGAAVPDPLLDAQTLYNLRMKPWSSVGVPEMPSYEQYTHYMSRYEIGTDISRASLLATSVKSRLVAAQKSCIAVADAVADRAGIADEVSYTGGEKDVVAWFNALQKTCVAYQVELTRMSKMNGKLKIVKRDGYHPYFPVYSLANV